MKIFSFILFFIIPILLKSQSYNWINKCGTIWIDDSKLCGDANGNYYLYGTVGYGLFQGYFILIMIALVTMDWAIFL